MPYRYVAIAPTGEQVRGAIDVPSEAVAERALWDADYRVVSIRRQRQMPALESVLPSLFAVKKRTLITFSRHHAQMDGQIFALAVMAVAASEVVVGLGLIVAVHRRKLDLDVDKLSTLRG